jgi:excisionase family DNA binding protein
MDDLIEIEDAARYLHCSVATVRRYTKLPKKPLPHYRIGGKLLFKKADLDMFLEERRVS